jgi:hypothetical protein
MTDEMKKEEPSTTTAAAAADDGRGTRKIPRIQYLLAHGDPERAHLPKSWCELVGFPIVLGLVFVLSFVIFLQAPHHLAPLREKYTIPGYTRPAFLEGISLNKKIPEEHKKRILEQQRRKLEAEL